MRSNCSRDGSQGTLPRGLRLGSHVDPASGNSLIAGNRFAMHL